MKKLKNYKIYSNGKDFLSENYNYLHQNKKNKIETAFFELNAKNFHTLDKNHYAIAVAEESKKLVFLKCAPYNALLFGDIELALDVAQIIKNQGFIVDNILGEDKLVETFLMEYNKLNPGTIKLIHSMSIMVLETYIPSNTRNVIPCTNQDLEDLAVFYKEFELEIFNESHSLEEIKAMLKGKEQEFYVYKEDGKIVSMASKKREEQEICAISHVYTSPSYRGRGYSKKIVTKLVEDLLQNNKIPYLYVDNHNPISNQLYLKVGFTYLTQQSHYQFIIKQ